MRTQLHQHYVRWCYRWIIITGCLAQGHKMLRIFCLKRWVGRPLKILSWKFEAKLTRKKSYGPVAFANCKQDFAFKFVAMDFIINESANDSINKQHDNSEAVDLSLPKGRQKCGVKRMIPYWAWTFHSKSSIHSLLRTSWIHKSDDARSIYATNTIHAPASAIGSSGECEH